MRIWLFIAALTGAAAVLLGAFAAHGLSGRLAPASLGVFETAARYQMYHALAMGLAALAMRGPAARRQARIAAGFFAGGILLFCGSLYLLALTGGRAFAFITPAGGLAFILGWFMLAMAALKLEEP
ncbi:MAG TPA: DUF423 domain-containing protein [Rhizomicrobium sp.]|jgi:uncharacterized membrane protein YgdD (TMEM256/DUF423 family)|nr:DUF423 domain-containing protein [Rhizomicrobium sp.]